MEKRYEICHDGKEYLNSATVEKPEILLMEKRLKICHDGDKI